MNTLKALNLGSKFLKKNNIETFNLDSELLLADVLKFSREKLLINLNYKIKKKNIHKFKKRLLRRKNNEPIAYILKKKEFWKHTFFVNKDVLIPRPETEIIIDELLKDIGLESSKNLLDVGTGSGCIIISILKERSNCVGTAIDISQKALNVAKYNAKIHHIQNKINFINIDIDKHIYNKYDFVLSNPPYISKFELKRLGSNVKSYEPHLALEAGVDGLNLISKLILKSKTLLKKRGKLIFEIGEKQVNKSKNLLLRNGFYINKICKDIYLKPRVIISTKL
tara:strand:+ start:2646 stop:3488 length:843 start_codon:yes stop_codon:yes gene_type:complete